MNVLPPRNRALRGEPHVIVFCPSNNPPQPRSCRDPVTDPSSRSQRKRPLHVQHITHRVLKAPRHLPPGRTWREAPPKFSREMLSSGNSLGVSRTDHRQLTRELHTGVPGNTPLSVAMRTAAVSPPRERGALPAETRSSARGLWQLRASGGDHEATGQQRGLSQEALGAGGSRRPEAEPGFKKKIPRP